MDSPELSIDLENHVIEEELISAYKHEDIKQLHIMPVFQIGDTLTVASANPDDLDHIDIVQHTLQTRIEALYATRESIQAAIAKYYGANNTLRAFFNEEALDEANHTKKKKEKPDAPHQVKYDILDVSEDDSDAVPVVRAVNYIFKDAIEKRASDIHIEPSDEDILVRFRIDGVCVDSGRLPKEVALALVSRIKVIGMLDIAESRIPQDGSVKLKCNDVVYDLRISVLPTVHGENIVIRIAGGDDDLISLDLLGLEDQDFKDLKRILSMPQGILLVTGPTGSGKTTTLYAALNEVNHMERNIITLEDPVEKQLPLLRQVLVNEKAGLTFSAGLRSILRQDPDIIMVGEIRDFETVSLAVRASLTGHFVLSSIHTNDAVSTVTRLIDMGVKPFLVGAALKAVIAQRLVRKTCSKCKEPFKPEASDLKLLNLDEQATYYKGKGCDACKGTGFKGRVAIYEFFILNNVFKRALVTETNLEVLKDVAVKNGLRLLASDGAKKVARGLTTPEQVIRASALVLDE